jgi:hypothetical protein
MLAEQALLQQANEGGLDEVFGRMVDFYSTNGVCMSPLNRRPLSVEVLGKLRAICPFLRMEYFLMGSSQP